MNNLEVENQITNDVSIENKQRNFLQTNIGKAVNTGLNIGLRYILPDVIEDQVIEIKDSFLQNGFKEGIQTAIDSAINFGKSALGIVTGNFENVQQMQAAVKSGGIIDGISNVLNFTINKVVNSGKIPYALGSAIKTGKNAILNNITKNIESEFENQVNQIEKLNKYTNNWKDYFNNKDFYGMQREYDKIRGIMKEIAPIENTIKTARVVENLHKLIKNNGKNFDLTSEELELAKML
jgi:hypothetical protein